MAQSVRFDVTEAGRRLATEARRALESLPAAERRQLEAILASNRDGRGSCGLVILTPTGAGRHR